MELISENAVRAVPDVNTPPMFESASMMREVNENETENAGDPVTADDADDDSLTYSISGGADMDAFGIVPAPARSRSRTGRSWTPRAHRLPTRSRSRPPIRSAAATRRW